MAVNFQRDDAQRLVIVVGSGAVSQDDWASCVARQLSEGVWHYGTLFDFRAVGQMVGFTEHGVRQSLSEVCATQGTRGPVALVSANPTVYAGFEQYADLVKIMPHLTRAFRDVNQAAVWLEQELSKPRTA